MTMQTEKELWLPVVGYETKFLVSSHGRVFSFYTQDFLYRTAKEDGYMFVSLERCRTNNSRIVKFVHVLVLEAFVGPRPEGMVARHLDDDKNHNFYKNLVWGTYSENLEDRKWCRGTTKYKLFPNDVRDIRKQKLAGIGAKTIASQYNIHWRTVYDIMQGLYHKDVA